MSDEGRRYVKSFSPFTGTTFWVHYVFGDIANAQHGYELTISDERVCEEWPFSKRAVERARSELTEAGFITQLERAAPGRPVRYRFDFPPVEPNARHFGGRTPAILADDGQGVLLCSNKLNSPRERASASRRKPERSFPVGEFTITEAMKAWVEQTGLGHLNLRLETERFRDHALANDRRCRDWVAAWRNWLRTAGERAPAPATSGIKPLRTSDPALLGYDK